jgi:hypothetical protein
MIQKILVIAAASFFCATVTNAQVTNINAMEQQAFRILKGINSMSKQQYSKQFIAAKSVLAKQGEVTPESFYDENYDIIVNSGIDFRYIKFVEFNSCPSGMMSEKSNMSTCTASTLVFEYYGHKYYVKTGYFYCNNKYYLVGFRSGGIKKYSF